MRHGSLEQFVVPEYYPPGRDYAWALLGPKAERAIVEDYEDRKYRRSNGVIWPNFQRRTATINRFIEEFGCRAAQNWGMASFWQLVMEDVWKSPEVDRLAKQFYDGNPWLDRIKKREPLPVAGNLAVMPISIDKRIMDGDV